MCRITLNATPTRTATSITSSPTPSPNLTPFNNNYSSLNQCNFKCRRHNYIHKHKRKESKFIANRSSYALSSAEISVLERGLTFIPTPKVPHKSDIIKDINTFAHKLNECTIHLPQQSRDKLTQYIDNTKEALSSLRFKPPRDNLTQQERAALKQLSRNTELIFKKTDKGSIIIIDDKDEYITDCNLHLNDRTTYRKLGQDPTLNVTHSIKNYLHDCYSLGLIDTYTLHRCTPPDESCTQKFYMLRKMHKDPKKLRPIVSACTGATEHISNFLDSLLQPAMKATPSYIKDSKDFIKLLDNLTLPHNTLLVTIDVTGLYTHIPQDEGIEACIQALKDFDLPHKPPEDVLRTLMQYILEYNTFEFDGEFYQQICGTSMGTKMAPAYATLFMHKLETEANT